MQFADFIAPFDAAMDGFAHACRCAHAVARLFPRTLAALQAAGIERSDGRPMELFFDPACLRGAWTLAQGTARSIVSGAIS